VLSHWSRDGRFPVGRQYRNTANASMMDAGESLTIGLTFKKQAVIIRLTSGG
jgi:hypothetical protein